MRLARRLMMGCVVTCVYGTAWAQEVTPPRLPAIQLPEVQVPATVAPESVPVTTGEQTTTTNSNQKETPQDSVTNDPSKIDAPVQGEQVPAAAQEETASADPTNFIASYGTYETSVFFTKDEIERMKKVLYISESFRGKEEADIPQTEDDEFKDLLGDLQQQTGEQAKPIDSYPVFHLASIVYKSPRDWAFWLNGERVTPKQLPADIEVVGVSNQAVRLHWKPENISEFRAHWKLIEEGDESVLAPLTVVSKTNNVALNDDKDAWQFTLRPNQTFSAQFMAVLEGRHAVVSAGDTTGVIPDNSVTPPASAPTGNLGDPDAALRGTMNQLIQNNRSISGLSPANSGSSASSGSSKSSGLVSDVPPAPSPAPPTAPTPATAPSLQNLLGALSRATSGATGAPVNPTEGLPVLPNQ